ncbi:hypothetical protein [Sorangium cellulosum]|uniref:Secreted protein n=1 Tax=Sorangium cellulosum TaxID=56 RepID=A0A150QCR5_SORCE|nr:hypothetical protein [Sorangium cellulosum]KYF65774.1 hypothetical protein BE15_07430 [Sorangium cellulosum]
MIVRPIPRALLALLVLCSTGCGSEDADALVVVGLTTDMAVGFEIDRVERTTRVDGVVTRAESLSYGGGELSLPSELALEPARDGAEVELTVEAFRGGEGSPFVTRRAATRAVSGRALFLPVSLDAACSAISCAAGATCAAGACVDPFIEPSTLADHDPTWIASASDACKTPSSGDPAVVIGQGESAFAPLEHGDVVPIEPGPQGGHHVWLALRVTGLRQMGSRLTVGGYFPELAFELRPFTSVVTLRRAGDAGCEIYGIRFQVDRGLPVASVRGRALDVEAVLEDPDGDVGTAAQRIVIAP